MDVSLLDTVITTVGVIIFMAVLCCICCLCMKISDIKMRNYIIEFAKQKGIKVDPDGLDLKHKSNIQEQNENCTIMIPDVGLIL